MSLLASRADFEPANPTEGATALYYQPADGSGYRVDFPFFQTRVDNLKTLYPPTGQTLAIWGCGFGATVNLAQQAGYNAYGFDASSYAITRGKALIPAIAARLFVRDALVSQQVSAARGDAGLKGQTKFALVVTEDMLTCMSNTEISTALPLLRGIVASGPLLHVLTVLDPTVPTRDARLNWKTPAQWKPLLTPDRCFDTVAHQEF